MGADLSLAQEAAVNGSNGLPADRKLGRYEVVAELGKGAMGTVYKAHDPLLGRMVALKTISFANSGDTAEYEARFYQEAKATGTLNHPNIVTIYDVGKSGDVPYLAMEHLEGSALREIMRRCGPLAAAHAVELAAQVADGLAYAHEHGVVHRDVKPANIMVVRGGLVKIADFGVARMRSSGRGYDKQVVGSPRYMSPEQVLRRRAEHRSDIFSLGVVLYETLTGAPPFSGADLNAIMFQIVNSEPPPPSASVAGLSAMVDLIVAKALAKAPEDRYQTARELAADLREARRRMPATTTLAQLALPESMAPDSSGASARPRSDSRSAAKARTADTDADEYARTLGLSNDFDSLSETARPPGRRGVLGAFASFVRNAARARHHSPARERTAASDAAPMRSLAHDESERGWSQAQRFLFGAIVAIAAAIAVVIVFA